MSKKANNNIKKILRLVTEIHSKILEPSTTNKVATGIKNAVENVPNILKRIQQKGGKNKSKKNKVIKNKVIKNKSRKK